MKLRKIILPVVVLLLLCTSGCWDRRELDVLKIVTGFCLDKNEQGNNIKITVQIEKGEAQGGGQLKQNGGESSSGRTSYELSEESSTIEEALNKIQNSISGTLFLHQIQVVVISEEIASEGILGFLDYFLRNYDMRLEEYLLISEGKAADLIKEETEEEISPLIVLMKMQIDRDRISDKLTTNIHELVVKHLERPTCPLIPVVRIEENENKKIRFTGMGVIKDGKLIGKLDEDQTIGYIWTEGKVNQGVTEIKCEQGAANLAVIRGKSTATPVFDGDGGIYIRIKTRTTFGISEIYGFENIKIDEVLKILKARAAEKISGYITDCFEKSISLNADIYGFGDMIRRKHPKVWKSIKDSWEQIYPSIKIQTDVDVKIANEGKITNSLIMGEK